MAFEGNTPDRHPARQGHHHFASQQQARCRSSVLRQREQAKYGQHKKLGSQIGGLRGLPLRGLNRTKLTNGCRQYVRFARCVLVVWNSLPSRPIYSRPIGTPISTIRYPISDIYLRVPTFASDRHKVLVLLPLLRYARFCAVRSVLLYPGHRIAS